MRTRISLLSLAALPACLLTVECSPIAPMPSATSGPPVSASQTLGAEPCRPLDDHPTPLIVDWPPAQRGDLELALREGVAVIHYDCDTIRVLRDCRLEGEYGFAGMTTKRQLVRLDNQDEIKINLPLMGSAFAAKLGGEIERGANIEIALAMIGQRRTTRSQANTGDLKGACEGATHFVRGVTVGAFAMQTGTRGSNVVAADVFGGGGQWSQGSSRLDRSEDGELNACNSADPQSAQPPGQCGAFLRLELVKLGGPASPAPAGEVLSHTNPCPAGLALSEGKCADPGKVRAFLCNAEDTSGCEKQCRLGDTSSCVNFGQALVDGAGGVAADPARARPVFQQACDAGDAVGCNDLGYLYASAKGVARDDAKAVELYRKSCDLGAVWGCNSYAILVDQGRGVSAPDPVLAGSLYRRVCDGGEPGGCFNLGLLYREGRGVAKDPAQAARLYNRACVAGNAFGCGFLGDAYATGNGVAQDKQRGLDLLHRACDGGHAWSCERLQHM